MHSPVDDLLLQDNPPTLRGVLDDPPELRALLSLLRSCAIDGWLRLATVTWSSDIFFRQGRVVAARRAATWGVVALEEILADSSAKWFSLSTWALLDGVTLDGGEVVLESLEAGVPAARALPAPGPAAQLGPEVLGLVDQVRGQVRLPVDALEVTAVLESLGITDQVAVQRYGAPDVFVLAEDVHRSLGPLVAAARG